MTAGTLTHNIWTRTQNTGSSVESANLKRLFDSAINGLRVAESWNPMREVFEELDEMYNECSESDWDGYGASPLLASAYEEATAFLNSLPSSTPPPEVVPHPDGSVGFEWRGTPERIFSISLSGTGQLVYAGLFGKGIKAHGTEAFDDAISQIILELLSRTFSEG